jgi:transposase
MGRGAAETWTKRVDRWRASGLTAKEFAAETGLNAGTLTYWKWRLGRAASGGTRKKAEFVEVVPPASPAPTPHDAFEVVLGNGMEVRVPVRFDADALRRLVAALGGA